MSDLEFQVRIVAASALWAASFGGRRLLPAPGTGGACPSSRSSVFYATIQSLSRLEAHVSLSGHGAGHALLTFFSPNEIKGETHIVKSVCL